MKDLSSFLNEKKDTAKAHSVKEGEGRDDKRYLELLSKYKQARKKKDGGKREFKMLEKLLKTGDVSKKAKLAGAYL